MATEQTHRHTNRLAGETSPYLLQHAHNPVDWHPWGEAALATARREDRPIFLSIGYAACHWCHVMERESFENEATARVLNEHFVPIKVDREERPDLDEVYMTATQMMSGSGGWPMSVFLTPDLKPFFAGTYFPPEDGVYGRVGFRTLCLELAKAWRERRDEVLRVAGNVAANVQQMLAGERAGAGGAALGPEILARAVERMGRDFDPVYGGFGRAPKFPPSQRLAFFVRMQARDPNPRLQRMIDLTLDFMARGGMYDQVGGGFHRYSTDERWLVPHFEKMLYDNAQLASVYLDAGEALSNPAYHRIAREVLEDVLRRFVHPEGGIDSTLDADSEGEEGRYYVWTPDDVIGVLGREDGEFFNRIYDVAPGGNWEGKSIPNLLRRSLPEWAEQLGMPLAQLEARVDDLRARLREAREGRVPPGLDDKILAAWNGLMIRAFARGYEVLRDERYRRAAERAAEFVLTRMRRDGRLLVTFRVGEARLNAYLDDYAFMAAGLLQLHAATGEARWLEEAKGLIDTLNRHFWDEAGGGYFFTSHDHEALIARAKTMQDSAIPSGNAVAALALAWLAQRTGDADARRRAERIVAASTAQVEQYPAAFATMLIALETLLDLPAGETATSARSPRVTLEASAPARPVRPGETFRIAARLRVPPGWHVNANPPSEEYLIPTTLELLPVDGFETVKVDYPPARPFEAGFAGGGAMVYEGEVPIEIELRASEHAPGGEHVLQLSATYQPCTDRECLPPATQSARAVVRVAA